jgi:predicted esterase
MPRILLCVLLVLTTGPGIAEIPPLEVTIGDMVESISCASDPSQSYTLYLPSSYTSGARLPVLLVFDPRGRSLLAAELFRDAAEVYGWIIVSSDNTRSDGPWEPNVVALQALWPEIHARLPADFDRIYAAGFSGGAAVATLLAKTTGEVAGILACGGRFFENQLEDTGTPVFSTAGDTDFNFLEMHRLDEFLAKKGNPHRLVIFEGAHIWMPPAVAREAIEWFELLAMRRGVRDRDQALVDSLYAADLARARELEEGGRFAAAMRRLREMELTYAGLRDTLELEREAESIESTDEYQRQRKRAKKARGFQEKCEERRAAELTLLRNSDVPPPTRQLAANLQIGELKRISRKPGEEGMAAQRCLASLYSATSFYLPLGDLPQGRYAQVASSYELSLEIRDDNPVVWYNLACVRAQLGQKKAAVEALSNALDNGFNRYELLETDTDLDPLRKRNDFKELMASAAVERQTP